MTGKQETIDRLIASAAETITEDEVRARLSSGNDLTHYIGFEISGYVHLGTGLMSALVMKDLTELGVQCTVWLADWHTIINEKLDGTLESAQTIAQGYFTEAMRASFMALGGNPDDIEFRLASEWYDKDWSRYWETVIRVAQHTTESRGRRSIDIMGREQGNEVALAKLFYPAMQAADIFYQDIDIAHAGMDQRKAHVIMRDVAGHVAPDKPKPIALHHPLLEHLGGSKAGEKMSKSDPSSAVFIHDEPEEIEAKIKKAYCSEGDIEDNPVLNWTQHLLFRCRPEPMVIERTAEHGGDVTYEDFEGLQSDFATGRIHPLDLKRTVSRELATILGPVREHFGQPDIAAKKAELDDVLKKR